LIGHPPELILAFLDHLEQERHNSVRSRNLRLTALRAFLKFAGRRDVTALHAVERAMAVPMKRFERPLLGYLTRDEMIAVLGQPGRNGLRSETTCCWPCSTTPARGSPRSSACAWSTSCWTARLRAPARQGAQGSLGAAVEVHRRRDPRLAAANPTLRGEAALLPNRDGQPMTRCNVAQRLNLAVARAAVEQPSLLKPSASRRTP
jgi:site-specific recombinase XerD